MGSLNINIAGIEFKNPIIPASGAFGFGREYEKLFPLSKLGGIATKGTTLEPRDGNLPPRVAETASGMLNSVGLQNPGIDYFIKYELPFLRKKDTVIISNIAGNTIEDYVEIASLLNKTDIDMIELNISCPNVKQGGVAFGTSPECAANITEMVKKATSKPLIVKLSPNVTDIAEIARAVEGAGADCISLINTLLGMRIDIKSRRPILKNNVGGLSGPAVFPVALRMVWQVANAVKIPVIGMGGVSKWQDAVEMMMAGACAIQVGAAIFNNPFAPIEIIDGLQKYVDDNNIQNISEIVGTVSSY